MMRTHVILYYYAYYCGSEMQVFRYVPIIRDIKTRISMNYKKIQTAFDQGEGLQRNLRGLATAACLVVGF